MKKILLVSLIWFVLSGLAFSQSTVKSGFVGITWKQPMQAEITGWNVLVSKVRGTGYIPISSVMYNPGSGIDIAWRDTRWPDIPAKEFNGIFTIPETMIVRGRMERFYFVMTAYWPDRVSIYSSEIYFDVDLLGDQPSYKGTPYKGVPFSIPCRIEAEDFDKGGEGIAYHDTASYGSSYYRTNELVSIELCSEGGFAVGYISDGEWLIYTVSVAEAGKYDFIFRVASGGNPTKKMHMEIDGVNVTGPLSHADVTGWQSWKDLKITGINLTVGNHLMKVVFDTWGFNLNYIDVKKSF